MNSSLEDLSSSIKEVCAFHRGEGAGHGQATPKFISTIPQDDYHKTEDGYLSELTAYTKKQFQVTVYLIILTSHMCLCISAVCAFYCKYSVFVIAIDFGQEIHKWPIILKT